MTTLEINVIIAINKGAMFARNAQVVGSADYEFNFGKTHNSKEELVNTFEALNDAFADIIALNDANPDKNIKVLLHVPELVLWRVIAAQKAVKENSDVFKALHYDWMDSIEGLNDAITAFVDGFLYVKTIGSVTVLNSRKLYKYEIVPKDGKFGDHVNVDLPNELEFKDGKVVGFDGLICEEKISGTKKVSVQTITRKNGETFKRYFVKREIYDENGELFDNESAIRCANNRDLFKAAGQTLPRVQRINVNANK